MHRNATPMNFHWIYELPFGTGKRWLADNPLRYVAGGWSVGNISTFQSGAALTVTNQTNTCNCFSAGPQRPNVTGDPDAGSHTVCVVVTDEFLRFSKSRGNDLSTPAPQFGFAGLKAGDRWCLCAPRWQEAFEADSPPRVVLPRAPALRRSS